MNYPDKMKVKPLTKKEQAWLDRLEKVMNSMPGDRLECYTIGDSNLVFFDRHKAQEWEEKAKSTHGRHVELDQGEIHDRAGTRLADLWGDFQIGSAAH